MSRFEPQPPSIQLNAVTDNIDETKSLPKQGLSNAGLEMVEVIDRRAGIKIRDLVGENSTQSKRGKGVSPRGRNGLCSLGCRRSSLSAGQPIDLVVIAEDGDIWISPRGMKEVVSSDTGQITIS
jgi:hypothetical protein